LRFARCPPLFAPKSSGSICAASVPEPARRAVYDAFVHHHVLCFRDQSLTKDEQIAFTEQFGTLERHIARNRGSDNPWVPTVSNLGADGRPSGKVNSTSWHTDKSFRPEPSLATILHAVTMPPDGGDTCFSEYVRPPTRR
jgi:taurine dioxygenase